MPTGRTRKKATRSAARADQDSAAASARSAGDPEPLPSLAAYRAKRNFAVTPEPQDQPAKSGPARIFCIQKHRATRLHYDLRLELDGVMLSWAVPKGPSLDPAIKRLAVEVEPHPIAYADFEGVIPRGEYGAGTVIVWDNGTWEAEDSAHKGYHSGKLSFELHGHKLHGMWTLVRTRGTQGAKPSWLLMKKADEHARPAPYDVTDDRPESVLSGRTDIEEDRRTPRWHSNRPAARDPSTPARVARNRALLERAAAHAAPPPPQPKAERGQVARLFDSVQRPAAATPAAQPARWEVQLASPAEMAPRGEEWVHEIKLDGYRIIAFKKDDDVRLSSRNGVDWTARAPQIARAVRRLPVESAIFDGELVAIDEHGRTSFQGLQRAFDDPSSLLYVCFDLPWCEGFDLTRVPLVQRKEVLRQLLANGPAGGPVQYSEHLREDGPAVFEGASRNGLEGIVSKRANSPYTPGRSKSWLKIKCTVSQEFVIGGFTAPTGTRVGLGALLLGYYDEQGRLTYSGRVGTGFDNAMLNSLLAKLRPYAISKPAFWNAPRGADARGVTWTRPELVAAIRFREWTGDGQVRHAVFQGLRDDKPARDVRLESTLPAAAPAAPVAPAEVQRVAEELQSVKTKPSGRRRAPKAGDDSASEKAVAKPASATPSKRATKKSASAGKQDGPNEALLASGVTISHPDKVLFTDPPLTKLDLANYYALAAGHMLPHIAGRPIMLVRCPQGVGKPCFHQKNMDTLPAGVHGEMIHHSDGANRFAVVSDEKGLLSLVQWNTIEFHTWGSQADDHERANRIVFDLDPGPDVEWRHVIEAARMLRRGLNDIELESFVKTTGGKGLHVVLPLNPPLAWPRAKAFAKFVADTVAVSHPDRFTVNMSKAQRPGKIYVDYLRNERGATCVEAYSVRARQGAGVSTPLRWQELDDTAGGATWTVLNIAQRLERLRGDPWKGYAERKQTIAKEILSQIAG